jgi:acetate kinase
MDTILVVNAGSSSLKFQVFRLGAMADLQRLIKGQIDGIGTRPRLRAEAADKRLLIDQGYAPDQVADLPAAIQVAGDWLFETQKAELVAVGHRVVHGGPEYERPVLVDAEVLKGLEHYVSLAPLHQPNNLAPIRTLLALKPDLPQVACFDTAFHRYGLSYEYVAESLRQIVPETAMGRVIVAHLGSGASMCALAGGRSVESTMGFTALDGLPMGTRPGQLDPGVVLYLIGEKEMAARQVQHLLYHECGLKGLSGISNDVRELEASTEPRAALALGYFAYRVGLHAGMLAAALGGLDAFVFTAGIGENSATMRARIAKKLAWLGVDLDPAANAAGETVISRHGSSIALYIVPTDEELMIARHTLALLSRSGAHRRLVFQNNR